MFLRMFLILGFIMLSFDAQAKEQEAALCNSFKDTSTRIDVFLDDKKIWEVSGYSFEELQELRQMNFGRWQDPAENDFWISDEDQVIGGFFRVGYGIDISYGFKIAPYKGQEHLSCVFIDFIKVKMHYTGVAFTDPLYDNVQCRDGKAHIREHLKKRYSIGGGIAIGTRTKILKELPKAIPKMEYAAVKKEDAFNKVENMKKALNVSIQNYEQAMRDEIIELNSSMDVPESMITKYAECTEAIPDHSQ